VAYDYREFDNALSRQAGPGFSCVACGHTEFSATSRPVAVIEVNQDGYLQVQAVTESLRTVTATFCGARICDNCGFVHLHALIPLGIKFP
jgi:hypothetical protein